MNPVTSVDMDYFVLLLGTIIGFFAGWYLRILWVGFAQLAGLVAMHLKRLIRPREVTGLKVVS